MNISEYFNSPEFKKLVKPYYDKIRESQKDSDNKYLDFRDGIHKVTSKALLYYQQFMFNKESSQVVEDNFHAFMQETVNEMCNPSGNQEKFEMDTMIRYYKLNNPDKTWENETQFNCEFIGNIVKSACKYHAFNSAFEEGIKENGINPDTKPFDEQEIAEMQELFDRYGNVLTLGCSSRSKGRVYYSTTPSVTPSYGSTSPEWFNEFCNHNLSKKNYEKAKQYILSKCESISMPEEDSNKVLGFFEKNWNRFAIDTKPKVVMVPENYDDKVVEMELEFCDMQNNYSPNPIWGTYNTNEFGSSGINCETDKTIDVTNAEFIDMPEVNTLLKELNQEYRMEQEGKLAKEGVQQAPITSAPTTPPTTSPTTPPTNLNGNGNGGQGDENEGGMER